MVNNIDRINYFCPGVNSLYETILVFPREETFVKDKQMPVVDYRLYGALWQELFVRSLQDPPHPPETRFRHTAMH